MCFSCPDDARWDSDRCCGAFGIAIGEYEGVVRVCRRAFQSLLNERPTPEPSDHSGSSPARCLEAYYVHRTRLELIAERMVRRRQLTDNGNIEITSRVLREREHRASARPISFELAAP